MPDRDRYEALYRSHAAAVRTYARRRTGAGEADDVVADVFMAAWRRIDDAPDDALPWLLGIARGVLANRRRGWRRGEALVQRLVNEQLAGEQGTPAELDLEVVQALGRLSEQDQELLLLIAWEGLSRRQVGVALGLAPGTVGVRLHRARRRLAAALDRPDATASDDGGPRPALKEAS